jgi:predicted ATPase
VLTGGPGAGKTAVLEVVRRRFCRHVSVVNEAASIIFGGGFPRHDTACGRRSAQRAIYHVQHELERLSSEEADAAVAVCDRGTLDALAYWPDPLATFFRDVGTTREKELARYAAVIHLRVPPMNHYNHDNPLRIESARRAHAIDARIAEAWEGHPRRFFVESTDDFIDKVKAALTLLRAEIPGCCAEDAHGTRAASNAGVPCR